MRIKLIGDNLEITDEIRQLIYNKLAEDLEKMLPELNQEIKTADMRLSKHSRWGYEVNFDLRLPEKEQLYAEVHKRSLKLAMTELREQLEGQIRKYREKLRS